MALESSGERHRQTVWAISDVRTRLKETARAPTPMTHEAYRESLEHVAPQPSECIYTALTLRGSGVIGVGLRPQHWSFLKALQMGNNIAIKDIVEPLGRFGIRAVYWIVLYQC